MFRFLCTLWPITERRELQVRPRPSSQSRWTVRSIPERRTQPPSRPNFGFLKLGRFSRQRAFGGLECVAPSTHRCARVKFRRVQICPGDEPRTILSTSDQPLKKEEAVFVENTVFAAAECKYDR